MGKNQSNEKEQKQPLWRVLAWPARNISMTIGVLLVSYVSFFCTDVLGMNIGIVGTILLASKVFDALTDLVAGYIVDRTHTRFGKARPYEAFIIVQWIFTILLFAVPNVSQTMQYIYIFIMYVMINAISLTALGAIDSVYLARAFTKDQDRTNVLSITGIIVMVVSIAFSTVFPQFMNSVAGTTKSGWIQMAIMLAIPLSLIGILRFLLVKEVVQDDLAVADKSVKKNDMSMVESIKLLGKNKYAIIIILLMFITNVINNMGTINTYYFKYIVGDIGLLSLIGLTSIVTPVILIFFPVLSKKLGTTKVMRYSFMLGLIGILIRTFGGTNMLTILLGSALSTVAVIPITVMINIYLIDCMDYGEWVTGKRVEGQIASINNFAGKLGSAIASGAVGVLAVFGYDGTLDVQSQMANNAIIGMFNIFPLILMVIIVILSYVYKMDDIRSQIKSDLEERNKVNE